jgi:hypothetical protein
MVKTATTQHAARSSPGRASSPAKKIGKKKGFSANYAKYSGGLQGAFLKAADKKKRAKTFYLSYKDFKGPKIVRRADGKLCFEHPDNKKNLIEVTTETFASGMARTRQDYELSRGKQPNARMKGMGAKEGFHKDVEANNGAYDPDGQNMHKWTSAIYWGTDESRGMSGTVNERGFDFIHGKTVMGDKAFDKHDFGVDDVEREVHDLVSDSEEEGDDDEMEEEDEEEEDEEEVVEEEVVEEELEEGELEEIDEGGMMTAAGLIPKLSEKQIRSIVSKAKSGNKQAVQLSALENGTTAQIKNLHKRLHLAETDAKDHAERVDDITAAWGL